MNATAEDIRREDEIVAKIEAFAARLKDHQTALGLSADTYGRVIGTSGLSVYCWTAAKSYPKDYMVKRIEQFMQDAPDQKQYFKWVHPDRSTRDKYAATLREVFPS